MKKQEWIDLARKTVPDLENYLAEHIAGSQATLLTCAMDEFLSMGSWRKLYVCFERAWAALPDKHSIRHGPFFRLCDLCSEYDSSWADTGD